MLRHWLSAVVVLLALDTAGAHDFEIGPLKIEHPWTRATPKGSTVAGGYLKITNTGTAPDRLIGGSLAAAGRFEIHAMRQVDGVMQMRPVPSGLEIKPGQTVEFKPGALHLMFMRLQQPLEQGKPVKGTLVFERAGTIEVEYAVEPIGSAPTVRHRH